jgi:uncharacterized membrane protein YeaQ/YmgE (transglycosylase-associated protein family)
MDPVLSLILVIIIGIIAGIVYDRYAGPGWLTRQIAGQRRGLATSCLVGIAGSFIGFHVFALLALGASLVLYVGAAIGAAAVLWVWRAMR